MPLCITNFIDCVPRHRLLALVAAVLWGVYVYYTIKTFRWEIKHHD